MNAKIKNKMRGEIVYAQHKKLMDKIKHTNGCFICGQTKRKLDFHHVNPKNKSFNIMTAKHKSIHELILELNKCVVLCRNCHQREHKKLRLEK